PEFSRDFLFANRSLVVIEEIEPADFERAIVGAITGPDAAIVSHYVEPVFTVDGGVDRTNGFARRVLAVLTHHRLMHHLRIFWKIAVVLIERLRAREVTVDPDPVHRAAVRNLQFADDGNVVFGLTSNDTGAASGADIEIDRHSPLLRSIQRRMAVK